jgi:hypothetical protein
LYEFLLIVLVDFDLKKEKRETYLRVLLLIVLVDFDLKNKKKRLI